MWGLSRARNIFIYALRSKFRPISATASADTAPVE